MLKDTFIVEGKEYSADDLTFREQHEMRRLSRTLVGDPNADMEDMSLIDVLPALVYLIVKRTNPDYTLDQALDLKISDLIPEEEEAGNAEDAAEAQPDLAASETSGTQD